MQCVFCNGKVEERLVTFTYEDDGNFVFIENVPAYVCIRCGENTYSPETTDELLRIVKQRSTPSRKTVVPVYDFALNLVVSVHS